MNPILNNDESYFKSYYMKKYQKCLQESRNIKLCPRGYCTAKTLFKVYPSAYANGYATGVCKGSKPDLEGIYQNDYIGKKPKKSDIDRWYRENWVNVCEKDNSGNYRPCGRKKAKLRQSDYPYCRPLNKLKGTTVKTVKEMSKNEISKMCRKKRSIKPGVKGKPTRVYIENPATGRKVLKDGRIGRRIQREYRL